jgi:hypothetical protein
MASGRAKAVSPAANVPLCTTTCGLLQTPGCGPPPVPILQKVQVEPGQSVSTAHSAPTFVPPAHCLVPSSQAKLSVLSGCTEVAAHVGSSGSPGGEPELPWQVPLGQLAFDVHAFPALVPPKHVLLQVPPGQLEFDVHAKPLLVPLRQTLPVVL